MVVVIVVVVVVVSGNSSSNNSSSSSTTRNSNYKFSTHLYFTSGMDTDKFLYELDKVTLRMMCGCVDSHSVKKKKKKKKKKKNAHLLVL